MSQEAKIKGIIIRKTNFSDNDIIFDVLTETGGVIGFFARGARRMKSKFSGVIQLGLIVDITYSTGKNLNYPREISIDNNNYFSFYRQSMDAMHFYTDILAILKSIAKDLEEPELFTIVIDAFHQADQGNNLTQVYSNFLIALLELISIETDLKCYISGEVISEPEFYYSPDTNKTVSLTKKPLGVQLEKIHHSIEFSKIYLQKLVLEHINPRLRLKF